MHKILCFIDKDDVGRDLQELLDNYDSAGNEVNLYTNVALNQNDPLDVLYELDQVKNSESEGDNYIFITNMKSLFAVIYRMLHQVFDQFVYYDQPYAMEYRITGIYQDIFGRDVSAYEGLHKTVFSNINSLLMYGIEYKTEDLRKLTTSGLSAGSVIVTRKYYYHNDIYYLFEPIIAEKKVVIYGVDGQDDEGADFVIPGLGKMQYMYSYPQDNLNKLFLKLDNLPDLQTYEILNFMSSFEEDMKNFNPIVHWNTCSILEDAARFEAVIDIRLSLFLYSFLMQVTKSTYYYSEFLKLSLNSSQLTCDNRFFLWHQSKRYTFTNKVMGNQETNSLSQQLYHKTYQEYSAQLEGELTPIRIEDRNPDFIMVFTIQFLSEGHAPTRTTLERCYTLAKLLGKKILLINTKEQYTTQGELLVYQCCLGNVITEYNNISEYKYKDLVIPFYQPEPIMPSIPVIREIIDQIRILKPSMIFSIGDGSIVADLCGKLVPEASIGVVFSNLTTTKATFSVIGRKIAEKEWDDLLRKGYTKESIIESTFTFELKEKKKRISRESLQLPTDRFLLVTVGIRLDMELEDDFFEMLQETYDWGTHIVFAGNFTQYGYFCDRHPSLREHSTFIGYYPDILALMEVCDLYVNPRRPGGGFSIIEAFHEGKPGVTLNFGDISVAAGKDFCVSDYKEMVEVIRRYIKDQEFYQTMSDKARAREIIVTSSAIAMEDMIDKIKNSPLFF